MVTSRILNSLEQVRAVTLHLNLCNIALLCIVAQDAGDAQSSNNWRLIMTYFNMIKIIESTGIGLVYGLQFYAIGQLDVKQMVTYVEVRQLSPTCL